MMQEAFLVFSVMTILHVVLWGLLDRIWTKWWGTIGAILAGGLFSISWFTVNNAFMWHYFDKSLWSVLSDLLQETWTNFWAAWR